MTGSMAHAHRGGRRPAPPTAGPWSSVALPWGIGTIGEAETWNAATGTFSPAGSLAAARRSPTATLLADGGVLVVGGEAAVGLSAYATVLSSAEVFGVH